MSEICLTVTDLDDPVPGIRTVTLSRPDGGELPTFPPGSHLVMRCGPAVNAYSLTGPGLAPTSYTVSVQRIGPGQGGLGGSAWVHDHLQVGDAVQVETPQSAFPPVRTARRHLYIAAGIGITPIVSHVRAAVRWDAEFELIYLHRAGAGAYRRELEELAGERMRAFTDRHSFVADLGKLLSDQPVGTHLYLCGPASFMEMVVGVATTLGWPTGRVHLERFGLGVLDPGAPFQVEVAPKGGEGSGTTACAGESLTVPSGVSLLSVLLQAGYQVPNMCRKGVCGECRITVAAGAVEHRDLFLDEHEKADGTSMLCCVSRASETSLVVAL